MSKDTLLRNPVNIGDIFFSGSQSVKKGDEVTWILDDTWAFKATEDCGVSTNASPFVQLRAGQTFIIYKRTQEDIDAGNSKGVYIFDRDTVVALAYPQEVTQDIVIANENYNEIKNQIDNYNDIQNRINNNINVDTMSHVIASTGGDQVIKVNYPVTLTGSYTLKAGWTVSKEEWHENNVLVHTGSSFAYTPTTVGGHLLYYTVTATDGNDTSKAQASLTVTAKANIAPIAKITGGTDFYAGESTTMSSYSSSDPDGSIASTKWYVDNVLKSSGTDFTYSNNIPSAHYIKLVVTDNDGATGEDVKRIVVKAVPVEDIIKINLSGKGNVYNMGKDDPVQMLLENAGRSGIGSTKFHATASLKSRSTKNGARIRMTIKRNGSDIGYTEKMLNFGTSTTIELIKDIGRQSILSNDKFQIFIQRVGDTGSYDATGSQLYVEINPN